MENISSTTEFASEHGTDLLELCDSKEMPDIVSYLSANNIYVIVMLTAGAIALAITFAIYINTLKHVLKNTKSSIKAQTVFIVSVGPVVSLATYCSALTPRAQLLGESIAHAMFTIAAYKLFCLIIAYCGGEKQLMKLVESDSMDIRTPPCCCWPCCFFLPKLTLNKRNIMLMRILVLQLPILQALVYLIIAVVRAEDESLKKTSYSYLQPIISISMLVSVWGLMIMIRLLRDVLTSHWLNMKFLTLKLIFFLAFIQGLVQNAIPWSIMFNCDLPITPQVYGNLLCNSIVLIEMILLGYWTRALYIKKLPKLYVHKVDNERTYSLYAYQ